MTHDESSIKLALLECLLQWEGSLNNARLRSLFNIRSNRASVLLKEFRTLHPNWVELNSLTKSFDATYNFYKRIDQSSKSVQEHSLQQYLTLIRGVDIADFNGDILSNPFPGIAIPKPKIFAFLNASARKKQTIKIIYRSLQHPEPHLRLITPFNIFRVGQQWYVRAYCYTTNGYSDFSLSNIVEAKPYQGDKLAVINDNDVEWAELIKVKLIAHPELSSDQQDVIKFVYFNGTSSMTTSCRVCLLQYFVRDVKAAVDITKQHPPEYQLAVENIKELGIWLSLK